MVKEYELHKTLVEGETYTTPEKIAYVIKAIGTDSTGGAHLVIDNKPTGDIVQALADLYYPPDEQLGPLDLQDLFYVIPPETEFSVSGGGTDNMTAHGTILENVVWNNMPSNLMDRYDNQFDRYYEVQTGETELVTGGAAWSEGDIQEIYSLTPLTSETYEFNRRMVAYLTGNENTEAPGDVGLFFEYDNTPMPFAWADNINRGLDFIFLAEDTDAGYEAIPWIPEITVEGDDTFTVKGTKTSANTLNTGTTMSLGIRAIVEYYKE